MRVSFGETASDKLLKIKFSVNGKGKRYEKGEAKGVDDGCLYDRGARGVWGAGYGARAGCWRGGREGSPPRGQDVLRGCHGRRCASVLWDAIMGYVPRDRWPGLEECDGNRAWPFV